MNAHLVSLLARRVRLSAPSCGPARVLSIDGRSGAGKSSLARSVVAELGSGALLVQLEDLYPGWDGLAATPDLLVRWVLAPLAAGRRAVWRRFDWQRGVFGSDPIMVGRPRFLVLEGVGALSRPVRPFVGVGVWVSLDGAERYRRAMARDGELYRPHWARWARQEARYLAREHPERAADLTIRSRRRSGRDGW